MRKPIIYSVLIGVLILSASTVWAGDTAVLSLQPPSAVTAQPVECDLREGEFDGCGKLDMLHDEYIVIEDNQFPLASGVVFKHLDGSSATAEQFLVGTKVWFVLYPDNTIKSVWKEGD